VKFTYALTLEQYRLAQHLHYNHKTSRRVRYFIYYRAIPALALFSVTCTIAALTAGSSRWSQILFPVDGGLIWMAVAMPISRDYNIRKCFKRMFPPTQPDRTCELDIDEERILSAIPGVSEGKIFWKGIIDFAQNEDVTLMYVTETRFLIFPTQAMSPAQRIDLSALVERYLVRR
jgi:hypothetical protein